MGCHWRFAFSVNSNLFNLPQLIEFPQSYHLTKDERACEQHFQQTTTRIEAGLFFVKLPFKEDVIPLGDSFQQAKRRRKHFSTASPKTRASIPETKLSSKSFWILDTWRKSRSPKSQWHPASHSTCHTTKSLKNPTRQPSFVLFLTPRRIYSQEIPKRQPHAWFEIPKGPLRDLDSDFTKLFCQPTLLKCTVRFFSTKKTKNFTDYSGKNTVLNS